MTSTRQPQVDENGYPLEAVEAWAKHGLYPPPMVGSPNNPEVVRLHRERVEQISKLSPEEQQAVWACEREFMAEFLSAFGSEPTPASRPS